MTDANTQSEAELGGRGVPKQSLGTRGRSIMIANYNAIRERMAAACDVVRRDSASVRLVAVTKYAQWKWVQNLVSIGMRCLGESRPQQLVERAALARENDVFDSVEWHLIGHLQRNKVRTVLPLVSLIHSVDTQRLLSRIDTIAAELKLRPRVLLEVNVSGETAKDGFVPLELTAAWPDMTRLEHVEIAGLMTMAPRTAEHGVDRGDEPHGSQGTRTVFRGLRELRDTLQQTAPPYVTLSELSMGMSGDFEIAIEEGATIIRIGSALFEGVE